MNFTWGKRLVVGFLLWAKLALAFAGIFVATAVFCMSLRVALRAAFAGRFAGALAKACSWLYSYSCERLARFACGLFARLTGVCPTELALVG